MKRSLYLTFLFFFSTIFSLAQDKIYFAGVGGSYLIPTGTLSQRFQPAAGMSLFYGYRSSINWEWYGKFEYINFNKENREKLKLKRNVNLGGIEVIREFDLLKLQMDLKIFGISVNANSKLFEYGIFQGDLNFGFGIYRWESFRSEYFDTLRVDTLGKTYDAVILKVPSLKQLDWSGGFNFGINLSAKIFEPIWLDFSVSYKAIIGELWATLDLDLENVSVFQTYDIRLGLKARF
jgi:hypothetical protein